MNVELYGQRIETKPCYCALNGGKECVVENPYVNLYIQFKGCQADCKFCTYKGCIDQDFDVDKLATILTDIRDKVEVRKISFTGGEPTLNFEGFLEAYETTKIIPGAFRVVNTNGAKLSKLYNSSVIDTIDSISLSRHHYDWQINNVIFDTYTPSDHEIAILQKECDRKVLHLSCNLIKGYIDSPTEIKTYLEFVSDIGADDVGFVSLMPNNDYCRENYVDFNAMDMSEIDNLFNTKEWKYRDICECQNFLYIPDKSDTVRVIKVYHRRPKKQFGFENMLVFDGKNLKVGFDGKVLV